MQSTNFKYESPYLATRHFNFTMQLLGCSGRLICCCYVVDGVLWDIIVLICSWGGGGVLLDCYGVAMRFIP